MDITKYVSSVPKPNTKNALPLDYTLEYDGYALDLDFLHESIEIKDNPNTNVVMINGKKATRNAKKFFDLASDTQLLIDDVGNVLIERSKKLNLGINEIHIRAVGVLGTYYLIGRFKLQAYLPYFQINNIEVRWTRTGQHANVDEFRVKSIGKSNIIYITKSHQASNQKAIHLDIYYPDINIAYDNAFADISRTLSLKMYEVRLFVGNEKEPFFVSRLFSSLQFKFDNGIKLTTKDFLIQILCKAYKDDIWVSLPRDLHNDPGLIIKWGNLLKFYPHIKTRDEVPYPRGLVEEINNPVVNTFLKDRKFPNFKHTPPPISFPNLRDFQVISIVLNERVKNGQSNLITSKFLFDTAKKVIYPKKGNSLYVSSEDFEAIKKHFPDYKIGFSHHNPTINGLTAGERASLLANGYKAVAMDYYDIATGTLFAFGYTTIIFGNGIGIGSEFRTDSPWAMNYIFNTIKPKQISLPNGEVIFKNGKWDFTVDQLGGLGLNVRRYKQIETIKRKRYHRDETEPEFVTKMLIGEKPQKAYETNNTSDPGLQRPTTQHNIAFRWVSKDIEETSPFVKGIENYFCNFAVNGANVYFFDVKENKVTLQDDINTQIPTKTKTHFTTNILPEINRYINRLKKTKLKIYEYDEDTRKSRLVKIIPLQYDVGAIRTALHHLLSGQQIDIDKQGNEELLTRDSYTHGRLPFGFYKQKYVTINYGVKEAGTTTSTTIKKGASADSVVFKVGGHSSSSGGSAPSIPVEPNAYVSFHSFKKDSVRNKLVITITEKNTKAKVHSVSIGGATITKKAQQDEYGRDYIVGNPAFKWVGNTITVYYPTDNVVLGINGTKQIFLAEEDGKYATWFKNNESEQSTTSNYVVTSYPKMVVAQTRDNYDLRVLKLMAANLNYFHWTDPTTYNRTGPCIMDLLTRGKC